MKRTWKTTLCFCARAERLGSAALIAVLGVACASTRPDAERPSEPGAQPPAQPYPAAQPAPAAAENERRQSLDFSAADSDESYEEEMAEDEMPAEAAPPAAPASGMRPRKKSAPAPARSKAEAARLDVPPAMNAWFALQHADQKLSAAIQLSTPDCPRAEQYRRTVCSLAERICELESGVVGGNSERRCDDGRQRCSAATKAYAARCD